jgi:hypothetical protein
MIPVLTFSRAEIALYREIVRLGDVLIGEVSPFHGDRVHATYAIWLPDHERRFVGVESMPAARAAIESAVNQWLLRIGVFYPGQGVTVEYGRDVRREARSA